MNTLFRFLCLLTGLALLAGCAPIGPVQASVAQSNKPRNQNPVSSPGDAAALAEGNTAFAFDLYHQVSASSTTNLFFSPYSISTALAMAQAGASGETKTQMNAVLHFSLPDARLHPAFNALQLFLASREINSSDSSKKDFRLSIANAPWGQAGYKFLPAYLDVLAENYGAGLRLLDFQADPELARQAINDWIAQQTEQKIKDLMPPGMVDSSTRLVITNAIYFNAAWMSFFIEKYTVQASFNNLDGKQPSVALMNQQGYFNYYEGQGYQAIKLPYVGQKISMLVILPGAGKYTEVENTLSSEALETIRKGLKSEMVRLGFPKFKLESSFGLSDTLQKMGMADAFDPGKADFSGMDGSRALYISSVVHKAYVNVDEAGTEAAASTAIAMPVSMPARIVDFKADRPFIFLIQDEQSGTILFAGRVVNM